jgi:uncharacterized protein (DUF1015 family)
MNHILAVHANTGPVFLTYRDQPEIDALCQQNMANEPLFDFTVDDSGAGPVRHTLWQGADPAALTNAFSRVPCCYIADGHHRAAAAARAGVMLRNRQSATDKPRESDWFMAALFGAGQLKILPYNRVVSDLNGLSIEAFLVRLGECVSVRPVPAPELDGADTISMYCGGHWFLLQLPITAGGGEDREFDAETLQQLVLAPILGIDEPRTSSRIDFIGGIHGPEKLKQAVECGSGAVAFCMNAVAIETLMKVADFGGIMPPKSTWFEPKLRSGLLIHTLEQE